MLIAIARIRDEISLWLNGGQFLPPTTAGDQKVVGIKAGKYTFLDEGSTIIDAYHALRSKVIGSE